MTPFARPFLDSSPCKHIESRPVSDGPGYIKAGPHGDPEPAIASLTVDNDRFGSYTVAFLNVEIKSLDPDPRLWAVGGIELTIEEAQAIIDALTRIVVIAIADGYRPEEAE